MAGQRDAGGREARQRVPTRRTKLRLNSDGRRGSEVPAAPHDGAEGNSTKIS